MKDLVIIGAGGFGREMITHVLQEANPEMQRFNEPAENLWNILGFIDENATGMNDGYPILGNLETLLNMNPKPYYFIAIANSDVRERIAKRCKAAGLKAATIYCGGYDCTISPRAEIGEGCYIGRNCGIMSNVKIGEHCILQARTNVGHETVIGPYTSVMTDASFGGETVVGSHCYFGLRCTIINQVNIADHCTFGACACVVKDCAVPGTYVGVPAKLIKPLQK